MKYVIFLTNKIYKYSQRSLRKKYILKIYIWEYKYMLENIQSEEKILEYLKN